MGGAKMIIYRKRNGGLEIDYLVFTIFKYKIWITKSMFFNKYPRIVIWKMGEKIKSWSIKFG